MRLSTLSDPDQRGLRKWAEHQYGDALALDGIDTIPAAWAWIWFVLREAEDRPEWFPHGKVAILEAIEASLKVEAQAERPARERAVSERRSSSASAPPS
jgi:hypothetical protein